ncbi:hypothetical protein ASD11_14645 [Aeromicrobium sp. Root495]|nr:hypothetical protein ASD11_14645 [Aeromicrobium sp. Root495]
MASAGVGLVVPGALVVFARAAEIHLPVEIGVAAGVMLAVLAVALEVARLRSDAAVRRAEMLAALATYLELFSMSLASGRGVPEAMLSSAKIGSGWTFELITDTITRSRRTGETPWHALGRLGEELALTELVDLASALALVGESGARVRASLAARSGTLRRRQLAEAAAEAAKNDDSMRVSQLLLAAGFMILIGYPAVLNVMAV